MVSQSVQHYSLQPTFRPGVITPADLAQSAKNENLFRKDNDVRIFYAIPIKNQAYSLLKDARNLLSRDDNRQWMSSKRG
jgi:hypothetical protein